MLVFSASNHVTKYPNVEKSKKISKIKGVFLYIFVNLAPKLTISLQNYSEGRMVTHIYINTPMYLYTNRIFVQNVIEIGRFAIWYRVTII